MCAISVNIYHLVSTRCQPGIQKQLEKFYYFMLDASRGLGHLECKLLICGTVVHYHRMDKYCM